MAQWCERDFPVWNWMRWCKQTAAGFYRCVAIALYSSIRTNIHPSVFAISSSAVGPSGWEGGEGATQSEPLHRDPQRGSREHAHRGQWIDGVEKVSGDKINIIDPPSMEICLLEPQKHTNKEQGEKRKQVTALTSYIWTSKSRKIKDFHEYIL